MLFIQFTMSRCIGNLVFCLPPTPKQSTTTNTPTSTEMVVLGTQDKIEDKSFSVFNIHPVSHSAMSAGFIVLCLLILVCLWFFGKTLCVTGLKKFKKATLVKQPDVIREANELEMGRVSSAATSPRNVWEMAKQNVPLAPPMPPMGFGMPPQMSSPWNSSAPSLNSAGGNVNREVIDKLDSVLQESRETQRNLYHTVAKLEADK